jgi:hypothetical protein
VAEVAGVGIGDELLQRRQAVGPLPKRVLLGAEGDIEMAVDIDDWHSRILSSPTRGIFGRVQVAGQV